jgi:hypothetical protein
MSEPTKPAGPVKGSPVVPSRHLLESLLFALSSLVMFGVLASCGISSSASLPKLIPASHDAVVFYTGTGNGSKTIELNQVYLAPRNPRYVPGGLLGINAACVGSGILSVRVSPGGESDNPYCHSSGGGGFMVTNPAKQPWPTKITITATKGTRWTVAVVDPQGSVGVAVTN